MNEYELYVYDEIQSWRSKLLKKSGFVKGLTKKAQNKFNSMIPDRAHKVITEGIKGMVKATLIGSNITTKKDQYHHLSLREKDRLLKEKLSNYKKTAAAEGAGTGAGGILLGLADFPLLLQVKMKFLFDAASVYGFDTRQYEERLFILHVFQLAFSNDDMRRETFEIIEHWDQHKERLADMDWHVFQQEYRDYIDFVKMLQLIPGLGAFVGAYANYNLLDHLGETAMNAYRLRLLKEKPKDY
ncbi:EcsC family protein [Piscibacillus salipiscarius]|uniref:EcsC family protein n=1 Tax=Piscibacillus salipiscarius TaxID=299480 RepID=A0ABW5Q7W9_9BACI